MDQPRMKKHCSKCDKKYLSTEGSMFTICGSCRLKAVLELNPKLKSHREERHFQPITDLKFIEIQPSKDRYL